MPGRNKSFARPRLVPRARPASRTPAYNHTSPEYWGARSGDRWTRRDPPEYPKTARDNPHAAEEIAVRRETRRDRTSPERPHRAPIWPPVLRRLGFRHPRAIAESVETILSSSRTAQSLREDSGGKGPHGSR